MAIVLLAILSLLMGMWGGIMSHQLTKFKENIRDQVQQAKDEKQRVETEHQTKYDAAQSSYDRDIAILDKRLRDTKNLPRPGCVQVADKSGVAGAVPRKAEDTSGTTDTIATGAGTGQGSFYENAMKDIAQCRALINLVR